MANSSANPGVTATMPVVPADAPSPARARRKWKVSLVLAVAYMVALVLIAIFAPLVAPYDPLHQDLDNALADPTWAHPLGEDYVGRDVLSRLIFGIRPTLIGTVIAVGTGCLIGIPWGLVAGYAGGAADLVLMRVADALLVFPGIILALTITSALGPSLVSTMVSVGIVFSPNLARIVRSGVILVRGRDYVLITRLFGQSAWYRMIHHVLPNAMAPTVVQVTLLSGIAILAQTGLNFLGLGVPNPEPSWGGSVAETFRYIVVQPQATIAPGLACAITVLAIYRIGDEIRDRVDLYR